MWITLPAVLVSFAAQAQNAPCDLTGLWVGETRMDRSRVAPTPSTFELHSSGGRITGTKPAQIIANREFPATAITGEMQSDGTAALEVASGKPDERPSLYVLRPSADCSRLEGKWSISLGGRIYGGTATYTKQPSSKSP